MLFIKAESLNKDAMTKNMLGANGDEFLLQSIDEDKSYSVKSETKINEE